MEGKHNQPNHPTAEPLDGDETTIALAWQEQVAQASSSKLAAELHQAPPMLYRRFAAAYRDLLALSRGRRRKLLRSMGMSLAGAALAFALALGQVPVARAASISVTTTVPDINADGQCSLIEAIVNANNDAATHADCAAGSGADTISLPANGTITLTSADNSGAYGQHANGLPVITSAITIEGNGATIARDSSAPAFRIFLIGTTGDLTLNATTVTGGAAQNFSSGGVFNFGGALTLNNSTVSGNNFFGVVSSGTATLNNSTISGNALGGIYSGDTLALTNSTVSGNGGDGVMTSTRSTASTTLINSTVSGNSGNGVVTSPRYYGTASTTLTNSTVSGNSGSGVVTQAEYSTASTTLEHSLISGNTGGEISVGTGGAVIAGNYNLFGHSGETNAQAFSGFAPSGSDINATSDGATPTALGSILNTTLANNGGPTETHALLTGSPAVEAAPAGPATDQRGFCRPAGAAFDIGAFELGAQACPSNQAPLAADDSYSTNEDTALSVPAPGVLSNDSDADSDPLTALLVSGPAHGTLTLNPDGSFTYTPFANFSGSDSFSYKANDGTADSNVATVSLTVVSALDQIDELIAAVQALVDSGSLNSGQGNALITKLEQAADYVAGGQEAQAISRMQTFISQVNSFIGSGVLTSAEGQPLIDAANAVIASLGG